jgi:hypothetical protein
MSRMWGATENGRGHASNCSTKEAREARTSRESGESGEQTVFQVNMWFTFVGGSGFPISPGAITALAYSDENGILSFYAKWQNGRLARLYFTVPANIVSDIQIEGRIVSRGGGFGGGGFGLAGIATGMLAAGALNAMTRHSEIQTWVRIVTVNGEIILFTNAYTPQVLRTVLSPLYAGVQKWTRIADVALSNERERDCPFCAERIKRAAVICRFCGRDVPVPPTQSNNEASVRPSSEDNDTEALSEVPHTETMILKRIG